MQENELKHGSIFTHAFNFSMIGTAVVDPIGRILKVNPSLSHILGFTENELISLTLRDITFSEDFVKLDDYISQLLLGKISSHQIETRLLHKHNYGIWTLLSISLVQSNEGNPLYLIIQVQNITERKKVEERYFNFIERSSEAMIIISNRKIQYINETVLKFLNISEKEEIIGKSVIDFIHPDKRNISVNYINRVEAGETIYRIEEIFGRVDGKFINVEFTAFPVYNGEKNDMHVIMKDISEKKKTEQFLLNSEKLNVAGQLAAGIAHEVRNPLTAIKGFLQIMDRESIGSKMYFDVLLSEVNRIELVLTELLLLSKPQNTKHKFINLESIIEQVISLMSTQAILHNIEIKKEINTDTCMISCDENQLKQVFINFIKNSIEAMPNGGPIYIKVFKRDNDSILIHIIDRGSGIPAEILKRIWEPFFTTKEKGTGLGMMICNNIIENHNGKLQISSSPNGTTIGIILPLNK